MRISRRKSGWKWGTLTPTPTSHPTHPPQSERGYPPVFFFWAWKKKWAWNSIFLLRCFIFFHVQNRFFTRVFFEFFQLNRCSVFFFWAWKKKWAWKPFFSSFLFFHGQNAFFTPVFFDFFNFFHARIFFSRANFWFFARAKNRFHGQKSENFHG